MRNGTVRLSPAFFFIEARRSRRCRARLSSAILPSPPRPCRCGKGVAVSTPSMRRPRFNAPGWLLSGHQLCEPGQIDIAAAHYADDRSGPAFAAEASCYRTGTRAFADDAISLRYEAHGIARLFE